MENPERETRWQRALEAVFSAVVQVRFCQTKSLDTEKAESSQGTGFVVDADRGFVLTNRHIVGPVPTAFWGSIEFENHEEIACEPVYSDPIHDYGIVSFDVKALKYMAVNSIPLRPDLAVIGQEIRVVGNDATEKLSVHSGVISRIDRNAPDYGFGYNDFNTFYIMASTGTAGGSSGSPVVNIDGHAVGLNCGSSKRAMTSFYLPLERVERAIKCLQNKEFVTRGTIQCQWEFVPYNKCIGLTPIWEQEYRRRFPKGSGMLVAKCVLPKGPSESLLKVGDVLLQFSGEPLTAFSRHDEILDSSVDKFLSIVVQRGKNEITVEVKVQDLYDITPKRYLSAAGGRFMSLSYQLARCYGIACGGTFVCVADGSFRNLDGRSLVVSIDGQDVTCLDSFIELWKRIPDQGRAVVAYRPLSNLRVLKRETVVNTHRWSGMKEVCENGSGNWNIRRYDPIKPSPITRLSFKFPSLENVPRHISGIEKSLVQISCYCPILLNSSPLPDPSGGIVLDATAGLVYTSRVAVPQSLCDIEITFADSVTVPAKFLWESRERGYTIVKYDPSLLDGPVKSIDISKMPLQNNASVYFVGMNGKGKTYCAATTITAAGGRKIPANASDPKDQIINTDICMVESNLAEECSSGVLLDSEGKVQAVWSAFLGRHATNPFEDQYYHCGLPLTAIWPVIQSLQKGEWPTCRTLGVELRPLKITKARDMNVSEKWVEKITGRTAKHHLLVVKRRIHTTDMCDELIEGDVILTLNDNLIASFADFENNLTQETINARIIRNRTEKVLELRTSPVDRFDLKRLLLFCGMALQSPMLSVRRQIRTPSDVYIVSISGGSPADIYERSIRSSEFIIGMNGQETPDLDTFIRVCKTTSVSAPFDLRLMQMDGIEKLVQIRRNDRDFPTVEWVNGSSGWEKSSTVMALSN